MTSPQLAVDYGTSNTVALLRMPDGRVQPLLFDGAPLLPSAVYAEPDGTIRVGRDAQRSARLDPSRYEPHPKRRIDDLELLLGEREHPLHHLIAATLRRVAQEVVRVAGQPAGEVTMTCPVEWGPARREVLTQATGYAGLPAPTLVPEPVAAATYFASVLGHAVPVGHCVVVYDLGGGTFDACVVRRTGDGFQPLSYRGLDDFGGVDLDGLVVEQVGAAVAADDPDAWRRLTNPADTTERRAFRMLWDDAREAKETLSRHSSAGLHVPLVDRDVHVSRPEFERAAGPAVQRTCDVTLHTIRQARIRPEVIAGLFLVGGSSRVPLVATHLHRTVDIAPTVLEQPELVVVTGALHAAAASTPASPGSPAAPVPPADSTARTSVAAPAAAAVGTAPVPPGMPFPAAGQAVPGQPGFGPPGAFLPGAVPPGAGHQAPAWGAPMPPRPHRPPGPTGAVVMLGVSAFFLLLMMLVGRMLGVGTAGLAELVGLVAAAVGGALAARTPRLPRQVRMLAAPTLAAVFGLVWSLWVVSFEYLGHVAGLLLNGTVTTQTVAPLVGAVLPWLAVAGLLVIGLTVRPKREPVVHEVGVGGRTG